jgi:hypothetical protein
VNLLSLRRISLCGLKNKGSFRKNFDVMERLISAAGCSLSAGRAVSLLG